MGSNSVMWFIIDHVKIRKKKKKTQKQSLKILSIELREKTMQHTNAVLKPLTFGLSFGIGNLLYASHNEDLNH